MITYQQVNRSGVSVVVFHITVPEWRLQASVYLLQDEYIEHPAAPYNRLTEACSNLLNVRMMQLKGECPHGGNKNTSA